MSVSLGLPPLRFGGLTASFLLTLGLALIACDSAGPDSETACERLLDGNAPPSPNHLLTEVSDVNVSLAWSQPSFCASGYEVERQVDGGTWEQIALLDSTRTQWEDLGLPAGVRIDYRVRPLSVAGPGEYASFDAALIAPWAFTADLVEPRTWGHEATLLPDGSVLLTGGYSSFGAEAGVQRFTPLHNGWHEDGSLLTGRSAHTATLLRDGTVLVVGGGNWDAHYDSAERYDPATSASAEAPSLHAPRSSHTATLLPDGRVLVIGGFQSNSLPVASAEVYDPAADAWTVLPPMPKTRAVHEAVLLRDGLVLVMGGLTWGEAGDIVELDDALLFDPTTNEWSEAGHMSARRPGGHTATVLEDGRVLVVGGEGGFPNLERGTSDIYNPASGTWTAGPTMRTYHTGHAAALLPSGDVLVVGGRATFDTAAEVYDASEGTWVVTNRLGVPRWGATATALEDGRVLVAGGVEDARELRTEVFAPPGQ